MRNMRVLFIVGLFVICVSEVLGADGVDEKVTAHIASLAKNSDMVWMLVCAFLVFFMQAGFAMLETGLTRAKNACNIMMKNIIDFSIGSIGFFCIGFAIMFGTDIWGGITGGDNFFLSKADPASQDGLWTYAFWLFQCVFAATAATIVSGAMAERTKFKAYLVYSLFISAIIYPLSGHWVWGGGWLSQLEVPMIDFAGSTVVHAVGGVVAITGAIALGPRIGKYSPDGTPKAIPGHSMTLAALGVFILWFGWFGFNSGSTTASQPNIGLIALTTNLAAASGTIAAMIIAWIRFSKPDISMTLNGALAGLVAITAGCANVSPVSAIIIGGCAGAVVVLSIEFVDKVLRIDDPVGAFSVHGVCGVFGTLCVGLFAQERFGGTNGLFFGGGTAQLISQLIGVGAICLWAFVAGSVLFGIVKRTIGVRVTKEEEIRGLDIDEHGMEAYSGFQVFTTE